MKIFVSGSRTGKKRDYVLHLFDEFDVYPGLWIARFDDINDLKNQFKHCTFISNDHDNPLPESLLSGPVRNELDDIAKYAKLKHVIYKMLDRYNPYHVDGHTYGLFDREYIFVKMLNFATRIVKRENFNFAIFNDRPHDPLNYIFYDLFQRSGVPIVILANTVFKNTWLIESNIGTNIRIHGQKLNSYFEDILQNFEKELINLSSPIPEYSTPIPNNKYKQFVYKRFPQLSEMYIMIKYKDIFTTHNLDDYLKPRELGKLKDIEFKLQYLYKKKKMMRTYSNKSVDPNINRDYIYFPLHYQPEMTTIPSGLPYDNQLLLLHAVSELVSKSKTQVYVKEHPSTFSYWAGGATHRYESFYKTIDNLANVHLIDVSTNHVKLLSNSMANITITGSVGWESAFMNANFMYFGSPWYECVVPENKVTFDQLNHHHDIAARSVSNCNIEELSSICNDNFVVVKNSVGDMYKILDRSIIRYHNKLSL